jgi:hypothetical protein
VIKVCRLSRSYFVGALSARTDDFGERSGTGIWQELAARLPRLLGEISCHLVTFLDREHQSRENHGTQKSRRNPHRSAIKSSHHLLCAG